MLEKISHNFRTALESIIQNKLRSFLTSLGIIFGVASVIVMMAIGRGAQEQVLNQLASLGTNNIHISMQEPTSEESGNTGGETMKRQVKRFSPGLTLRDAEAILTQIPGVKMVSPEVGQRMNILYKNTLQKAQVTGIANEFFTLGGFELEAGNYFTTYQEEHAAAVCIIGAELKKRLFPGESATGKTIKVGRNWLTVVGIAKSQVLDTTTSQLGVHDYRMEVFVPVKTYLLRFQDRSRVTIGEMEEMIIMSFSGSENTGEQQKEKNYHQLNKITVVVEDPRYIYSIASVANRMLFRRHNKNRDYDVVIPELLLKQKQETQRTFSMVLIGIASISLLVGGIGIMNIMLASVMERIKEIGVRLALGATKSDIILQFLSEAVTISVVGGIIGIIGGLVANKLVIEEMFEMPTIATPLSVVISFLVSITVGIVFGIFPASRAANQDPVVSLRYE